MLELAKGSTGDTAGYLLPGHLGDEDVFQALAIAGVRDQVNIERVFVRYPELCEDPDFAPLRFASVETDGYEPATRMMLEAQ